MSEETLEITLTVNGEARRVSCEPRALLSDVLREEVECTDVRAGCEHGVCGACTIMVDGAAVRSCIMLAAAAEGTEITTLAGLSEEGEELPPLLREFSDKHAFQCGFCTAGIVISVTSEARAGRSKESVMSDALGGHICRCTGYVNIRRAIDAAWDEIAPPEEAK